MALLRRSERNASSVAFFFRSASPFRRPAFFSAHSASEGSCSPENATARGIPSRPWYTFRGTGAFAERAERSFLRSPAPASASGTGSERGANQPVREDESPAFLAFVSSSAAEFEAARTCCSAARAAAAFFSRATSATTLSRTSDRGGDAGILLCRHLEEV